MNQPMRLDEAMRQSIADIKTRKQIRILAKSIAKIAGPIWHEGDGFGGAVRETLDEEFRKAGLPFPEKRSRS